MKSVYLYLFLCGILVSGKANSAPYFIYVDFSEAELYLYNDENVKIATFQVALPKKTPLLSQKGSVIKVEANPYWAPTRDTRDEYHKKTGRVLPRLVRAGDPRNAMGDVKIYIKWRGPYADQNVRIHGTKLVHTIGQNVSRGCIRMRNSDIKELALLIREKEVEVIFIM